MAKGVRISSIRLRSRRCAASGLALLLAGCATHNAIEEGTATAVTPTTTLPVPDPRTLAIPLEKAYYIGPHDKLDVSVYQLPDATRTVEVDTAGQVNLPFAGTVQAAGRTATEVRDDIAARLGQRYLQNPQVTVAVSLVASQRITVEGAVTQPGLFPVTGQLTLLQAIALASGTNTVANEHVVAIFRTVKGQRMAAVFDLEKIRQGELVDPTIYGNDIVVVERSRGKVILRDVVSVLPVLGVFRTIDYAF
ncbi:polysaccharide biosynthesis/export family protein [Sphingomonas prati]|uniref:Polysaccharide export outer membrane protein n=1 Tax=Sphingomonas prati TaxID=1843237 RepID=A0A7W9F2W1_9SPHN|nr:polysaccharide biosynthesis/export family protein [Sphingomonas prati]MBB5729229.1 polysaccharide export outer membrane protein [Sphingomonas prati]GGE84121.1 capsular polysaccharide biosynthesis protein [Sphingomonas prati]